MALVSDFNRLQRQMRRMMEDMVHQLSPRYMLDQKVWSPQIDIWETTEDYFILADVSGLKKNEIQVNVKRNRVHLYGRRERPPVERALRYVQMEIEYGAFERVFQLPVLIDEERIEARYRDGYLTVRLPKRTVQPKTIPIQEA
ncbi:MAG: Hsp20/alpha crystallin family protein [Desulfobacterota bacterium]|jgi:HSP20 family protein|nr:Hsp20/alpha crystallin family protein [Thermodesulfobacteriota bacterium]